MQSHQINGALGAFQDLCALERGPAGRYRITPSRAVDERASASFVQPGKPLRIDFYMINVVKKITLQGLCL
jgi:hypothetical protein